MSESNAVLPYSRPTLRDLTETIGITQFPSETNWFQTIGGLLIQGGVVSGVGSGATVSVPFNVGFTIQVLGVFVQARGASVLGWSVGTVTLADFQLINAAVAGRDFYWWAIGV